MTYFTITETKQKTSEIIAKMRKLFDVYSFYDDKQLDKDFPPPKQISTRHFAKNIEADEEYKNMSANDLDEKGVKGITLRERLLMEIQYFKETGNHLDVDNVTLCSGSRDSGGDVPSVYWDSARRGVYVDWGGLSRSYSSLRARVAVNPLTLSSLVPSATGDSIDLITRVGNLESDMHKIKKFLII